MQEAFSYPQALAYFGAVAGLLAALSVLFDSGGQMNFPLQPIGPIQFALNIIIYGWFLAAFVYIAVLAIHFVGWGLRKLSNWYPRIYYNPRFSYDVRLEAGGGKDKVIVNIQKRRKTGQAMLALNISCLERTRWPQNSETKHVKVTPKLGGFLRNRRDLEIYSRVFNGNEKDALILAQIEGGLITFHAGNKGGSLEFPADGEYQIQMGITFWYRSNPQRDRRYLTALVSFDKNGKAIIGQRREKK